MRINFFRLVAITAVMTAGLLCSVASYAQDKVYLEEHFDNFKAGSEDAYDKDTVDKKLDDLTTVPGWTALGAHQAGGTCVLVQDAKMYNTCLRTPKIETSGWIKVELKARIYPGCDSEKETMSMYSSDESWNAETQDVTLTREWKNVSFVMKKDGKWDYMFLFFSYDKKNISIQIDDVKISSTTPAEAKAPVALDATDLSSTGFTANWNVVSGADKYLLSVFEVVDGKKKFFMEDKDIQLGNKSGDMTRRYYSVEGLDPAKFYSYYLKTQIGNSISQPSNTIKVYNMVAPVSLPATDITPDGFVAHWEKTSKADGYKVSYYRYMPKWGRVKIATLEVDGGAVTSVPITGLSEKNATCFSYDVAAVSKVSETPVSSDASKRQYIVMNEQNEKEVLTEDFSKFTKGSMDDIYYNPTDPNDPKSKGEYVNDFKSRVIPDSYTQTSGWSGFGVLEAGGVAAVSYRSRPGENYGGELVTPALETTGGLVKVSFRLKTIDQYAPASKDNPVVVGIMPENEDASFMDTDCFEGQSPISLTDNDWHDYSLTYYIKEGKFMINFGLSYFNSKPFFIDDIKISLLSDVTTGINELVDSQTQAHIQAAGNAIVVSLDKPEMVSIYNAAGQLIRNCQAEAGSNIFSLGKGLYIVKTAGKASKIILK